MDKTWHPRTAGLQNEPGALALVMRRLLPVSPAQLFRAWTTSEEVPRWWTPGSATCIEAEIEPHKGGRYRIANRMPDGAIVWIEGVIDVFEPPSALAFSWRLVPAIDGATEPERVSVRFIPKGTSTEIVVVHERISTLQTRSQHDHGWSGCLNGLAQLADAGL